jgi:hypothetical protein
MPAYYQTPWGCFPYPHYGYGYGNYNPMGY